MSPLQIWLPTLSSSLSGSAAQRDSQRAFEVWNGESTVWMLPELKKTTWWSEGPGRRVVAIPSERLEKINIYHAGENGCVVGFAAKSIFPNGRIDGLLKLWLNFTQLDPVELYSPPATIHLEVPSISRRKVEFRKIVLKPIPHGMLPIVSVKRLSDEVWTKWPPTSKAYKTVSPDSESDELYGPFVRDDSDAIATGRSLKDKTIRTMFLFARWPEPLGSLIPPADGIDIFVTQAQMATIARDSEVDPVGARRRAREQAGRYVQNGHSSLEWTSFWPIALAAREDAVLGWAEGLGATARSLPDLWKDPKFRKRMAKPMDVRRAWGPIGLFWALLLEQLEGLRRGHCCRLCGRVVTGKKGKEFCGPEDNLKCYRLRRARDQRRSRGQG